ncbi:MAG: hypothetical protein IJM30_12535 [Thermoguttaceae bacterium]|nr:hypothetical protein [Thermoguttaceae bacterium]
MRLEFGPNDSVSFTKPTSFVFCGVRQPNPANWKNLYANICRLLFEKRKDVFDKIRSGKKLRHVQVYKYPDEGTEKIAPGYHVLARLGTKDIVGAIVNLLEECGVSKEEVEITYKKKGRREVSNSRNTKDLVWCNFRKGLNLKNTSPESFIYFGKPQPFPHSWIGVYITLCKLLLNDYPKEFAALRKWYASLPNRTGIVVDEKDWNRLIRPEKIAENYFVETSLDANAIGESIKKVLQACNVAYKKIEIGYLPSQEQEI